MPIDHEALTTTAALMEAVADHDEEARLVLAQHLSGALAIEGSQSSNLDSLRAEREEDEYNFNLVSNLVSLLPTATKEGEFIVRDVLTLRAVQAHAIETQDLNHNIPTSVWLTGKYYIAGSRPIFLEKKPKIPFTELLLWPANKGHVAYAPSHSGEEYRMKPLITAVPTSHYKAFLNHSEKIASRLMSEEEVKEAYDPKSDKFTIDDFDLTLIASWWSRKPSVDKSLEGNSEKVRMASPKGRWGYEHRKLDGAISTDDMIKFEVLDNMVGLVNEFGKGRAAAKLLLGMAATRHSLDSLQKSAPRALTSWLKRQKK